MSRLLLTVKYALLGALFLTGAWNCRKDVEEFRPYSYEPSQSSIQNLLGQVAAPAAVSTFILKGVGQDTTLTTASGVRVVLTDPDELFVNADNQTVAASTCQNLQIEIIEVPDKGDLLGQGLHTAMYPDGQLLETGAIVHVQASCDGAPLQLLPNRELKVQVPANALNNDLLAYNGQLQGAAFLGWQATGDAAYLAEWVTNGTTRHGYELYPSQLGWISAGRPVTEQTSGFCVKLPSAMTGETAQVFVVFKGLSTVATLVYDAGSQSFCFDQAPIGYPVQVLTISKLGEQYWLGNQETEIGTNTVLQVEPHKMTEAALLEYLKNL